VLRTWAGYYGNIVATKDGPPAFGLGGLTFYPRSESMQDVRDVCGPGNHIMAYDRTEDGWTVLKCQIPKCEVEEKYRP